MPSTVTDRIDGITTSAAVKVPVRVIATAPITLSAAQTIDGVLLTAYSGPGLPADRVLVNGQTDQTKNGIYLVQSGAWTREPDFDGPRDAVTGTIVEVRSGTIYGNTFWKLDSTDNPIIIDTSTISFSQFNFYGFATGTSATSNSVGTGAKTFTTQAGLVFGVGQFLTIADTANAANYMHGQVTSYSGTTLVFNSLDTGGSGTKTSWKITPSSPKGTAGATGATGATGAAGTNAATQINNFRLTLTTGTSVTISDVTGATTLYCTPYGGNQIGLYDGANWNVRTSAEFSLALGTLSSGKPYDVFCYDNSTVPTLEFVAWTNDTTRATTLTLQNGVIVKNGDATRRYLGTFYTTATTTTEDSVAKRFLWNYYNRRLRSMRVTEATTSWAYTTATYRQANAAAANQLDFVAGYQEDLVEAQVNALAGNSGGTSVGLPGIGLDSTSVNSANIIQGSQLDTGNANGAPLYAKYSFFPAPGRHKLVWLEYSTASGTTTWYGNSLGAQSGITGRIWS